MKHRISRLLLIAWTVAHVFSVQAQISTPAAVSKGMNRPDWSLRENAVPEQDLTEDSQEVLKARAHKFRDLFRNNISNPSAPTLGVTVSVLPVSMSPLPVAKSDLIVIAVPRSADSRFAENQSAVYTRLEVYPESVIFKKPDVPFEPKLSILYRGGFIKTSDGRVVGDEIASGTSPLVIDKTYLLFLRYDRATDSFGILRTWDVSNERPVLLNEDGYPSDLSEQDTPKNVDQLKTLIITQLQLSSLHPAQGVTR